MNNHPNPADQAGSLAAQDSSSWKQDSAEALANGGSGQAAFFIVPSEDLSAQTVTVHNSPLFNQASPTKPDAQQPDIHVDVGAAALPDQLSGMTFTSQDDLNRDDNDAPPPKSSSAIVKFLGLLFWDVWLPTDRIRVAWDLLMIACLAYVITVVPYIVAFDVGGSIDDMSAIDIVELSVSAVFMVDVLMYFRTAYTAEDRTMVTDRCMIAKHYLKGWFLVDIITSLPYDLMFGEKYKLFKALRLLRLFRLFRVSRLVGMLKRIRRSELRGFVRILEKMTGANTMRIIAFALVAVSLVHWVACLWYYIATLHPAGTETWLLRALGKEDSDGSKTVTAPNVDRYITALYWAVTTMTTVGYGDITPVTPGERMFAVFVMALGASLFAFFMGAMVSIIASMNLTNARIDAKRAIIDEFVMQRKLPRRLANSIHDFYSWALEQDLHADEQDIVSGLPASLRKQVLCHLYQDALEKISLFRGKHPSFLAELVACFKAECYSPGDFVVYQGDFGNTMFFVSKGNLEARIYNMAVSSPRPAEVLTAAAVGGPVVKSKPKFLRRMSRKRSSKKLKDVYDDFSKSTDYRVVSQGRLLGPGQCFGETACLKGEPYNVCVVAVEYCELFSLCKSDVDRLLAERPDAKEALDDIMASRSGSWIIDDGSHHKHTV